jgi:hypothetical protein
MDTNTMNAVAIDSLFMTLFLSTPIRIGSPSILEPSKLIDLLF